MKTAEFHYSLPKDLIAQKPVRPRDHSRLLILERKTGKIKHDYFFNLEKYLKKGDVLVLNNSRVFPARLIGQKPSGGKVEILLVRKKEEDEKWEGLVKTRRPSKNLEIWLGKKELKAKLIDELRNGNWLIQFNLKGEKFRKIIYRIGRAPTPPYIKRISNLKEYQTIYAKKEGSIAAPTAGFHFTKKLIKKLKKQGIKFKFITLHVGLGTFLPIRTEKVENHRMLAERVVIDKKTAADLNKIKESGGRIIAVGTSTVRSIESAIRNGKVTSFRGQTKLFIKPGHEFFIDGLITNFHLPRSTNLVLVSAFFADAADSADKSLFASKTYILKIYQQAIKKKYRFYSFGDAMLIT